MGVRGRREGEGRGGRGGWRGSGRGSWRWGGRGGGRGRGDWEEEGGDRVGRFRRGGAGVGEGEGALFFLLWGGEGGGEGSGGGGERHLFLKLREVWEEGFSVPSPFFLLRGCLLGGGDLEGVWVKSWMVVWVW